MNARDLFLDINQIRDIENPKNQCCRQGMNATTIGKFLAITIGLTLGLGVTLATAYRANVAAHWEERRCDPGVVPIAGAFKPASDPRTAGEFAEDNWRECQKEYIQRAVAIAAEAPKELAAAQGEVVAMASDATDLLTDVFVDVWRVCYEAYSTFMDRIKGAAQLFQNTLVQMHSIIGRLQASLLAIVYALISSIMAFVDSIKITLIVAIIVIGILVGLQIILFFLFLPISGLIITMTFVLSMVIVAVATAISAAMVSELFAPGACFKPGTRVAHGDRTVTHIEMLRIGDDLYGGGQVTAIHRFLSCDPVFDFRGISVTGDHLLWTEYGGLTPVREHPDARDAKHIGGNEVWCLTTTHRRIPCVGDGGILVEFADWEEIADDAIDQQRAWQTAVWRTLNGTVPMPTMDAALNCEAAIHPDTEVLMRDPWTRHFAWTRIAAVPLGAVIQIEEGVESTVLGRVEIAPSAVGPAVDGVSMGCWIWNPAQCLWSPSISRHVTVDTNNPWIHLYTSTGTITLRNGMLIRDASDVGLKQIGAINDAVVLGRPA
jgi:hypothetical protein